MIDCLFFNTWYVEFLRKKIYFQITLLFGMTNLADNSTFGIF